MALLKQQPINIEEATHKGASWLRSKYAEWILAVISFAESMFAPILIDPFLVALIFANRSKWIRYTVVAIFASVLGGVAGYALGFLFFDAFGVALLNFFGLTAAFNDIATNFNSNGFVFVLIGAFTPIPYKLVAIASGLLHINIVTFIVASIVGRILRLGLVAVAAYMVGPKALPVMQRHLHLFAAIVGVILIAYVIYKLV